MRWSIGDMAIIVGIFGVNAPLNGCVCEIIRIPGLFGLDCLIKIPYKAIADPFGLLPGYSDKGNINFKNLRPIPKFKETIHKNHSEKA